MLVTEFPSSDSVVVLDMGSGTSSGMMLLAIDPRFITVGVELQKYLVEVARAAREVYLDPEAKGRCHLVEGNITDMSTPIPFSQNCKNLQDLISQVDAIFVNGLVFEPKRLWLVSSCFTNL